MWGAGQTSQCRQTAPSCAILQTQCSDRSSILRAAAAHPPRRQRQRRPQAVALAAAAQPGDSTPAVPQQQQQQQDKPLPPYYQLSLPVYSLATVDPDGGSPTMNLVTYASPISLKPRHYALGLYLGTLSWQNMLATKTGVLQVLREQHAPLFELLGRTSGRDVDKLAQLTERGVGFTRRPADGIPLLDDSLGWVELRFASEPVNYGDHDVVICEVTDWHTPEPKAAAEAAAEARPLYTRHLRQLGLLP